MVIHHFPPKELDFIARENPQVIYIGTGQYGSLPITSDAEELLDKLQNSNRNHTHGYFQTF